MITTKIHFRWRWRASTPAWSPPSTARTRSTGSWWFLVSGRDFFKAWNLIFNFVFSQCHQRSLNLACWPAKRRPLFWREQRAATLTPWPKSLHQMLVHCFAAPWRTSSPSRCSPSASWAPAMEVPCLRRLKVEEFRRSFPRWRWPPRWTTPAAFSAPPSPTDFRQSPSRWALCTSASWSCLEQRRLSRVPHHPLPPPALLSLERSASSLSIRQVSFFLQRRRFSLLLLLLVLSFFSGFAYLNANLAVLVLLRRREAVVCKREWECLGDRLFIII